jgi:hypothetical protein
MSITFYTHIGRMVYLLKSDTCARFCVACKSIIRVDARESLKSMHTKVLSLLYVCVCSADLSFFLTYTRAYTYIVQLLLAASTTFCPFYSLSSLSHAGVFFDLYSQLDVCVCVYLTVRCIETTT